MNFKEIDARADQLQCEIDQRLASLQTGECLAVVILWEDLSEGSLRMTLKSVVVPAGGIFKPDDPRVDQWTIYGPKE